MGRMMDSTLLGNWKYWGMGLAAAALTVAGCEVGPNYHQPNVQVPAEFSLATTRPTSQPTNPELAEIPTSVELRHWWTTFHDPELNSLIERAINQNLSLQNAVQVIIEARAELGISVAGLYPNVTATGQYNHSRRSNHLGSASSAAATGTTTGTTGGTTGTSGTGTSGTTSTTAATGGGGSGLEGDFWQAGFDSTWEIDVFGGLRRGVEASQATYESEIENRREVLITLLGDVATDYVQLRGLQRQVVITQENINTQKQSLDLIQTKNRAGLVADLDVTQQNAQVLTTESQLPDLEAQIHQTIHALSVLLAQEPATLETELQVDAPIPYGPAHVPPGLPSELLRRRPDIRMAERQLAAATAEIGVAEADLFPKFSLTGSLGYESSQFHQLFNIYSRYFSIGPSVSWPIFDAGAIAANIQVQNALQRQAFYNYEATVLTSFQEVEDALVTYAKEQDRRVELDEAVHEDQRAVEMTQDLYKNGLDTFLDVLTAQNTLLAGEESLTQSEQSVSTDLVSLYKALGGGWEVQPE
jgi:NodT family efflux transporter outer membrane factor (OMF) lipoprotein